MRRWAVANWGTLPLKWPVPPWKVAGSCRWTQRLNLLFVTAVVCLPWVRVRAVQEAGALGGRQGHPDGHQGQHQRGQTGLSPRGWFQRTSQVAVYRGTSRIRNSADLGPHSRAVPYGGPREVAKFLFTGHPSGLRNLKGRRYPLKGFKPGSTNAGKQAGLQSLSKCVGPRHLLYTYMECHGRNSPSSPPALTTHNTLVNRKLKHSLKPPSPKSLEPHGEVRPFYQKSTCLTRLTLGRYVVQSRPN